MPPPQEASQQQPTPQQQQQTPSKRSVSPQTSSTPLISIEQRQPVQQAVGTDFKTESVASEDADPKTTGKRRFFGLGKKKEDKVPQQRDMAGASESAAVPSPHAAVAGAPRAPSPGKRPADVKLRPQPIPTSPSRAPYHSAIAASPSRLRSSSPRLHSPASSEIFERNVQEQIPISTLQGEINPAHIPTHVITEDHIPPALEASAQAITSENLNADEVEIVMSTSHQPAGVSVLEASSSHADLTQLLSPLQHHRSDDSGHAPSLQQSSALSPNAAAEEDGASTYGQLDPNDVRRLSFISFADVVQSEHAQPPTSGLGEAGSRDSLHIAGLPSSAQQMVGSEGARAASPLRSPTSTHSNSLSGSGGRGGVTTPPPPGVSISNPAAEQSPARSPAFAGSPGSGSALHGELHIETMRQAVRKTASGDLGAAGRNAGMSPVVDDGPVSHPLRRANS